MKALRQRIDESEAEAKLLQSKDSQQLAISKKLHSETKELEAALEDIALKQSETLKAAQLEQVLPTSLRHPEPPTIPHGVN